MSEDSKANPPIVRGDTAIKDIGTVVDFILARRNIPRLNLIGMVMGHGDDGYVHHAKPEQGRAAGALRARLGSPKRPRSPGHRLALARSWRL